MLLPRQILESTMAKLLGPLVSLGFTGVICALAAECMELVLDLLRF